MQIILLRRALHNQAETLARGIAKVDSGYQQTLRIGEYWMSDRSYALVTTNSTLSEDRRSLL